MIDHFRPGSLWRYNRGLDGHDPDIRIAHVINDESGSWVVFQPVYKDGRAGRPDLKTTMYFLKQYTPKD